MYESVFLNAGRCSFETIRLHFKAKNRRLTGCKSRFFNTEMQSEGPKMRFGDFETRPSGAKSRGFNTARAEKTR